MKIVITTTYEDVTEEFLEDYIKRFLPKEADPKSFVEGEPYSFTSKDPDGPTTAKSEWKLHK